MPLSVQERGNSMLASLRESVRSVVCVLEHMCACVWVYVCVHNCWGVCERERDNKVREGALEREGAREIKRVREGE